MESGRVDLGANAWIGWVVCIFGTCVLGNLVEHTFYSHVCILPLSPWESAFSKHQMGLASLRKSYRRHCQHYHW